MRILYSFLLATLLVIGGCSENSPTGPDIIDPPKIGPKPTLSLVDSQVTKIILDSRPFELEFRSSGVSVFSENKSGKIRDLRREDGTNHFFLNINSATKADEVQKVIAESDKGILTQLIVNLRINDGIDMLLAYYENELIQVTENNGYAVVSKFNSRIQGFDVFSGKLKYIVDTLDKLCIIDYTGENKVCEDFDGIEIHLIDDDNIVFSRGVNRISQIFTMVLSTGEERQITTNQCEQGIPEPCWNGAFAAVPYKGTFIAYVGYDGNWNQNIVGKVTPGIIPDSSKIEKIYITPLPDGEFCPPKDIDEATNQVSLSCTTPTHLFAEVYDIDSGTVTKFPPGTHSPSFVGDDRWLVMADGNDAITVKKSTEIVHRYPFPGRILWDPQIIIF